MHSVKHLRIFGLVQGVGYRESLRRQAEMLGLDGWVRNRLDGSVEAMVSGPADALEALVNWCWRGPALASVAQVDIDEGYGIWHGFERLPTTE